MFVDLKNDPYASRFALGIYGCAGAGKTSLMLDLAAGGDCVYLLSFDRGYARARLDPDKYKRLLPVVIEPTPQEAVEDTEANRPPSFTRTLYRRLSEIVDRRIPTLIAKGMDPGRIWLCLDTVTHMQARLLHEAQAEQIRAGANTTFRGANKKKESRLPDYVQSELITTPEWGANLAIMSGIADFVMNAPCNLVYLFLQKNEQEAGKQTKRAVPALSGASFQRYTGDVDVLLWMSAQGGTHTFRCQSTHQWEAKDRYGNLPEKLESKLGQEIPMLAHVRNISIGKSNVEK